VVVVFVKYIYIVCMLVYVCIAIPKRVLYAIKIITKSVLGETRGAHSIIYLRFPLQRNKSQRQLIFICKIQSKTVNNKVYVVLSTNKQT